MTHDKLARLGARSLGEKPVALNSAIKAIEQLVPVPEEYRRVLLEFGAAIWFDNGARYRPESPNPLTTKDGYNSLNMLYGLGGGKNSIERKAAQYSGELPTIFIPIGEAPGGNLVCIDGNGAVYLWDHESPRNEGGWRIAASIGQFLSRLEPDNSSTDSTDGIIESESFLDF